MNEIYHRIADAVCRHSELTLEQVLHSGAEYETDARYLLIHLLSDKLTNGEITRLTGLSKQLVSKALLRYKDRKRFKHSLQIGEASIRKELNGQ